MVICGIDPGLKGGIAFYDGTNLNVYATPVNVVEFVKKGKKAKRREMNLQEVAALLNQHKPDGILLERVSSRPGEGSTSSFRFGANWGSYLGVAAGIGINLVLVTPAKWKSHYKISRDKEMSLELARKLFPNNLASFKLKKHDGLAEAALLAKYGFEKVFVKDFVPDQEPLDQED